VNRKTLEQGLHDLSERKVELEERLREDLGGLSVFALAPRLCDSLLEQAQAERRHAEQKLTLDAVKRESKQLKSLLANSIAGRELREAAAECVDQWLQGIDQRADEKAVLLHGFASSDVVRLERALRSQLPIALASAKANAEHLGAVTANVTEFQDKLAHAPSDESIEEAFGAYQTATKEAAKLEMENRLHVENLRMRVLALIALIRKAKKLEEAAQKGGISTRAEELAEGIQNMIGSFKVAAAEAKCKTLERYFVAAFRRLARKEDIVDHAVIDPATFTVTLIDRHGRSTPKKRLSAGEKQIFAIAMLEALAKTSGRNLPIIIDTPLGRLDSQHRAKLVHSYFPFASHQVLVLSTDTEVDQAFYDGLRPSISHSFHLSFDETEGFTTVTKGYFWKQVELAHAA
jgi:DNA sulfur modification protein DndD